MQVNRVLKFNMYEIVVARFEEDLSWLNGIKHKIKIYNKGQNNINRDFIPLANIGREATTILYHIITQYDNLSEYTIFLQGNPFQHYTKTKELLHGIPESIEPLYKFSDGCWAIADKILNETQEKISPMRVYPADFHDTFFRVPKKNFLYASGAQYIVHKNNIRNKPITFYKKIMSSFSWKGHEPWSIERVWPSIFDKENKYKIRTKDMFL
jgi:hypothetical protein